MHTILLKKICLTLCPYEQQKHMPGCGFDKNYRGLEKHKDEAGTEKRSNHTLVALTIIFYDKDHIYVWSTIMCRMHRRA
ncbi:MAG: hypothetical protein KIT62_05660 [Cyclobacteriaceae bacterium]|nr:hypothetical protein [Cyclobacteriaceae bacterium]